MSLVVSAISIFSERQHKLHSTAPCLVSGENENASTRNSVLHRDGLRIKTGRCLNIFQLSNLL